MYSGTTAFAQLHRHAATRCDAVTTGGTRNECPTPQPESGFSGCSNGCSNGCSMGHSGATAGSADRARGGATFTKAASSPHASLVEARSPRKGGRRRPVGWCSQGAGPGAGQGSRAAHDVGSLARRGGRAARPRNAAARTSRTAEEGRNAAVRRLRSRRLRSRHLRSRRRRRVAGS